MSVADQPPKAKRRWHPFRLRTLLLFEHLKGFKGPQKLGLSHTYRFGNRSSTCIRRRGKKMYAS